MAYSTVDRVLARAGRVKGAFEVAGKRPNLTDLETFLADTAAEIDAAIRARGFDPTGLDQTTKDAFADLNAYGALLRALPGIDATARVQALMDEAKLVWESAMGTAQDPRGTIARGTFPAIAVLEAGRGGGGQGATAGSLWAEEPTYGGRASVLAEANALRDSNLAPGFSREQKF